MIEAPTCVAGTPTFSACDKTKRTFKGTGTKANTNTTGALSYTTTFYAEESTFAQVRLCPLKRAP
jgi:hypothetical protein